MERKYTYHIDCVSCSGEQVEYLHEMIENSTEVTTETFFRHVSLTEVNELFGYGLNFKSINSIKKDWHVAYYKSHFNGQKCYYLVHSAIEYIFIERI